MLRIVKSLQFVLLATRFTGQYFKVKIHGVNAARDLKLKKATNDVQR